MHPIIEEAMKKCRKLGYRRRTCLNCPLLMYCNPEGP